MAEKSYLPGERVRITFTATVTATEDDGSVLAQLEGFNGGYHFRIPLGATLERVVSKEEMQWGHCGNKTPHEAHLDRWCVVGVDKYTDYQCPGTPEQNYFELCVENLTSAIVELCYPEIVAKHLPPASRKVIENTARIHIRRAWNLGKADERPAQ